LVPAKNRVRLATGEFTSFALFWWNDLCTAPNNANAIPQTWNALKQRMKSCFVPRSWETHPQYNGLHLVDYTKGEHNLYALRYDDSFYGKAKSNKGMFIFY
jgi:hypothetical protein